MRARFGLDATEDEISSTGITSNITGLYNGAVEAWLSKNQVPVAFLFDHDNEPTTDAVVLADWNGTEWQTYRLITDPIAITAGLTTGATENDDGTITPAPIAQDVVDSWISDPLFSVGPIEDFGNLNLNFHVNVDDAATTGGTITLRITSVDADVDEGTPWNAELPWTSDVAIAALEAPETAVAAGTETLSLTVTNFGPDEVVNGEVFLRAVNSDGSVGARFTRDIVSLGSGESQSLQYNWDVPDTLGEVTWEASVEAFAATDPEPNNNEAIATTVIITRNPDDDDDDLDDDDDDDDHKRRHHHHHR